MTARPTQNTTADDVTRERYAELPLEDEVVIYDREHHPAWIQSSDAVTLAAMQ
jgi:hypothetical protein